MLHRNHVAEPIRTSARGLRRRRLALAGLGALLALAVASPAVAGDRHRHRGKHHAHHHSVHVRAHHGKVHGRHCGHRHDRHYRRHARTVGWHDLAFGLLLPHVEIRIDGKRHRKHHHRHRWDDRS